MRLQVAFDLLSLEEVLALLEEVHDLVDIVEIGTPLILKEGLKAVTKIKECYPDQVVLADLKIMDAGALEAEIGFDAGADMITVLGLASQTTKSAAKGTAEQHGGKIVVDLINHPHPVQEWEELRKIGMDFCCIHTAHDDAQQHNTPLETLENFHKVHGGSRVAVAGGVKPSLIREMKSFPPEIVVVGSYITGAEDAREAVQKIRKAMD